VRTSSLALQAQCSVGLRSRRAEGAGVYHATIVKCDRGSRIRADGVGIRVLLGRQRTHGHFRRGRGVHAGQLAHDPATDYTYVLSDDGAVAVNVYAPVVGTTTTVLPLATLFLAQQAYNVSSIAVDANYVYIPSSNNVTLYPKYDPTKPYAAWRAFDRQSTTTARAAAVRPTR
jgi:hypothetical protein